MTSQLANNLELFSQETEFPGVTEAVTLKSNTWNLHIKKEHPEVKDSLELVQSTIANPTYVAASRPGPNQVHSDNLVFVGDLEQHRKSRLHVFVQSPKSRPTISTALFSKNYHSDILWHSLNASIRTSYDKESDVLYLSVADPVAALTEEGDDGLLRRFSMATEKPVGVTVPSFRAAWSDHLPLLAERVAEFLQLSVEVTGRELALLASI